MIYFDFFAAFLVLATATWYVRGFGVYGSSFTSFLNKS